MLRTTTVTSAKSRSSLKTQQQQQRQRLHQPSGSKFQLSKSTLSNSYNGRILKNNVLHQKSSFKQFSTDSESVANQVDELINKHQVLVFSKTYCPFCLRVKELFQRRMPGVIDDLHIVELDMIPEGDEMQSVLEEKTDQRTVPSVWINQKHFGGCDKTLSAYQQGDIYRALGVNP
eukprot:gb/GECH01008419.1/.p1 GENE.gb/GECH01008419.1/~~gb/GECH01008419.1/.p1  ORF type:complete len:175 (+),score=41.86 gb/GECH01008419.1/:1-525(+)